MMQELRNETIRRDQTIQQLETELDALRAHNADLLAALEGLMPFVEAALSDLPKVYNSDNLRVYNSDRENAAKARAAIAAVKGEEA